jgi:F5/8 type C domain/Cellulase (glycosyl hydrolase family 5)
MGRCLRIDILLVGLTMCACAGSPPHTAVNGRTPSSAASRPSPALPALTSTPPNQGLAPNATPAPSTSPGATALVVEAPPKGDVNLALHKPVTASHSLAGNPPELAVDGDQSNWWGAGAGPPQWIEIDLGAPSTITSLRLVPSQSPGGATVHRVFGRGPTTDLHLLHEFSGITRDGQAITFSPPEPWAGIQFIRIETVETPSWVSWREIEIIGTPENTVTQASSPLPEHRIGVREVNGVQGFYDRTTGIKFVPRGMNYIRVGNVQPPCTDINVVYHTTFNVGVYDAPRAELALAAMQQDGYNVVRVFLSHSCLVNPDKSLSDDYMRNLADFIQRAKAHHIFVLITSDDLEGLAGAIPWREQVQWPNSHLLTAEDIPAEIRIWQNLIREMVKLQTPIDDIFAYDLDNEVSFRKDVPPLSLTSGTIQTGNGSSYDMADPKAKQQMMDDNLVNWIDRVRAGIRQIDPTALVEVSFPALPRKDPRFVRAYPALAFSTADFIDLHPYPGFGGTLPLLVDYFEMRGITKPILMGEFGTNTSDFLTAADAGQVAQDWQVESCRYGFDGWLFWTWDTTEDKNFWTAVDQGEIINRYLAPATRPDPCAPGTLLSLSANPPAADGSRRVTGALHDQSGKPLSANLPIQFSVEPLDGQGVHGSYSYSGIVPSGAVQADVGFRVNTECTCNGPSDFVLYGASFNQGGDAENRVPNGNFVSGMNGWGSWGNGSVRLEKSDRGAGSMVHVTASSAESAAMNSANFAVTAGKPFTVEFEARVAPASVGSGYFSIVFLGVSDEVERKMLPLVPAAFVTGEARTRAGGVFQFTLTGLPHGKWSIQAQYAGDGRYLPAHEALTITQ